MASPRRPAAQLPVSDRQMKFSAYGRYGWLIEMFVNSRLPGRARCPSGQRLPVPPSQGRLEGSGGGPSC